MMKESGNSAQKLAMCRILSTAKPFELLASKIAQFRRHSRGIFGGESRAVPRALEAMPLQHLQAAARVQFGQGAIHVSPYERLQPAARVQFSIGIPQGLPHECFGGRRSAGAAFLWLRLRRTVIFELKATITWQKARLPEWHEGCLQSREPLQQGPFRWFVRLFRRNRIAYSIGP
jgi:hypothetical protein